MVLDICNLYLLAVLWSESGSDLKKGFHCRSGVLLADHWFITLVNSSGLVRLILQLERSYLGWCGAGQVSQRLKKDARLVPRSECSAARETASLAMRAMIALVERLSSATSVGTAIVRISSAHTPTASARPRWSGRSRSSRRSGHDQIREPSHQVTCHRFAGRLVRPLREGESPRRFPEFAAGALPDGDGKRQRAEEEE